MEIALVVTVIVVGLVIYKIRKDKKKEPTGGSGSTKNNDSSLNKMR